MTSRKMLLAALASLGLVAGCQGGFFPGGSNPPSGDDDPGVDAGNPPPTGATARELFDTTVAPVLSAQCSSAGCHGGTGTSPLKFLPGEMTGYYDVVTSYDDQVVGYFDKTSAPILHKVYPGPHMTAVYTPQNVTDIEAWLDKELAERGTTTPPPPTGPQTPGEMSKFLISQWSGCMDLTDWDNLGVATAWAGKGSSEGPCIRCHINGQASFIATDDSTRMFNVVSSNKYYMLSFFTPNVTDMTNAKIEINYDEFTRVGTSMYPHLEHPQFDIAGSDAILALEQFYDATMAKIAAGTCGPPRIVDP